MVAKPDELCLPGLKQTPSISDIWIFPLIRKRNLFIWTKNMYVAECYKHTGEPQSQKRKDMV